MPCELRRRSHRRAPSSRAVVSIAVVFARESQQCRQGKVVLSVTQQEPMSTRAASTVVHASKREPTSTRAATVPVLAVKRVRDDVHERHRRRRRRIHASESQSLCAPPPPSSLSSRERGPRAPPLTLSSPSREQEPTSARASADFVVAVTQARPNVRARRR